MAEHPNVALVRRAMQAMNEMDMSKADEEMARDSIEGASATIRAAHANQIGKVVLTSSCSNDATRSARSAVSSALRCISKRPTITEASSGEMSPSAAWRLIAAIAFGSPSAFATSGRSN